MQRRAYLGNTHPDDGYWFRGRGFSHLTGRIGYTYWTQQTGVDIFHYPELVATNPQLAARILIEGMVNGVFTAQYYSNAEQTQVAIGDGIKLSDFTFPEDFAEARAIINSDDDAEEIAIIAQAYACVLSALCSSAMLVQGITCADAKCF